MVVSKSKYLSVAIETETRARYREVKSPRSPHVLIVSPLEPWSSSGPSFYKRAEAPQGRRLAGTWVWSRAQALSWAPFRAPTRAPAALMPLQSVPA